MVQLFNGKNDFAINLPTKLSEITPEYLAKVTEHIEVSNHYAIVALVLTAKLSEYCYTINNPNGKAPTIGVTPILVKFKTTEENSLKPGQIVVISDTDLERGNHIKVPTIIASDKVASYLSANAEYMKDIQIGNIKDNNDKRIGDYFVKLLQFKIIPVCDIHASYYSIESIEDDFVKNVNNNN